MKDSTKKILIESAATVIVALIGALIGQSITQHNTQVQMNETFSNVINITGDDNNVSFNDIATLVDDYIALQEANESLISQNMKYYNDLTTATAELNTLQNQDNQNIQSLQAQLDAVPAIEYRNMNLSIDGNSIPVNSINSSVVVNNRTYYSDDIVKNLISPNTNMTIQGDTMYIGKIIKEQAALTDKWLVNSSGVDIEEHLVDSYGNTHASAIEFWNKSSSIIYNLNSQYSLLKITIALTDYSTMETSGILTIKADDTVVYTSSRLTKTTKPYDAIDIPINNCSLLTLEYTATGNCDCIVANAVVYN